MIKDVVAPTQENSSTPPVGDPDILSLSHYYLEIIGLVAEGYTNGDIAKKLFCSEDNIKTHLRKIVAHFKIRNENQVRNSRVLLAVKYTRHMCLTTKD